MPDTASSRVHESESQGEPEPALRPQAALLDGEAATSTGLLARCHFLDGVVPRMQAVGGQMRETQRGVIGASGGPDPTFASSAEVLNLKLVSPQTGASN